MIDVILFVMISCTYLVEFDEFAERPLSLEVGKDHRGIFGQNRGSHLQKTHHINHDHEEEFEFVSCMNKAKAKQSKAKMHRKPHVNDV